MVSIKNVLFVLLAIFCLAFQSCNNEDQFKDIDNIVSVSDQEEEKRDGMFAVNFVNPDGTPYEFGDNLSKVTWGGSYAEYPYWTTVTTNWSTFCTGGETVKLSGGDGGDNVILSSSSGSYTIAENIAKNYSISVSVIPAPVTTYTITITIKATGIETGKAAKVTFSASGCTPSSAVKTISKSTTPGSYPTVTFTANKGSNVSISVSCTNYGADPASFSYSNISSDKSDNLLINY